MTAVASVPDIVELEHDTDEQEGLTAESPEHWLLSEQILMIVDALPALQRALLSEYYGLNEHKPLTLRELAAKRRVSLAVMRTRVDNALRMANKLLLDRGVRVWDV
jgi:DNA-directed RNA polymerase sigma subunit (sigma70/sigma32)